MRGIGESCNAPLECGSGMACIHAEKGYQRHEGEKHTGCEDRQTAAI